MIDEKLLKEGDFVERRLRRTFSFFGIKKPQMWRSYCFKIIKIENTLFARKVGGITWDGRIIPVDDKLAINYEEILDKRIQGSFIIDKFKAMVKYCL